MLTLSPESYGMPYPSPIGGANPGIPAAFGAATIDGGSDTRYAWLCQAPIDGVIERILFLTGTCHGQIRVSIQPVTNGVPAVAGTPSAYRSINPTSSAVNESGILTSTGTDAGVKKTVRAGEYFAVVFDASDGGSGNDAVFPRIAGDVTGTGFAAQGSYSGGVWTVVGGDQACGAIKYENVGYVRHHGILPLTADAGVEVLFNSGSAANEVGLRFKVPARVLADGFYWRGNALAGDVEVALYDGLTQIALSPTMDADVEFGDGLHFGLFTTPPILESGRVYRMILRPKSASNVSLATYAVHAAAIAAMHSGPEWYRTSRASGGAFTDLTTSVPIMGLMAEPETRSGHIFEMELSGAGAGWTDVSEDVLVDPSVHLEYGIGGATSQDLVASTGKLSFALDNSEDNSAELLGYYSPDNPATCRPGFKRGIGVRYSYRKPFESDYYRKFVGRLMIANPIAGQYRERRTDCDAYDWINEAASFRATVATQVAKRGDQVLTTLLAAMARQPSSTTFDVGDSTFAYALDTSQTEKSPILAEIQRLCLSEFSRCYIRGGMNAGGNLRWEKRTARLTPTTVASFLGTMQGLDAKANIKNRAKVTAHPRTVDAAATTVLFSKPSQSNPLISPSQTITITGRYSDPANRASRVGGTDMVAPVATTDYLLNAAADGSGADLTANLTVVATYGANQVDYSLTNTGGTPGYVTKLQARGRGIYDYTPIDAMKLDQPSIDLLGESLVQIDMPYQSDLSVAQAVADFVVSSWLTPGATEAAMRCIPRDDAEMDMLMALEPGAAIAVSESVTGINSVFFIQNVSERLTEYGRTNVVFDFLLQRALVANYWKLGTAGFGELGVTTVLAPL